MYMIYRMYVHSHFSFIVFYVIVCVCEKYMQNTWSTEGFSLVYNTRCIALARRS